MVKERVLKFFGLFFLFVIVLIYLYMAEFGSVTSFYVFNGNINYNELTSKMVFLLVSVLFFIGALRFLHNHHIRTSKKPKGHFDRGLIKVDLNEKF